MRVLLRSLKTELYYAGTGQWVKQPEFALDFELVERAAQAFRREKMPEVEVVLQSLKPASELRLPVPRDWHVPKGKVKPDTATSV
jgi:hypothetical protein